MKITITQIDEIHLKCDWIKGSFVKGANDFILFSFALDTPPGHETYKKPKIKLLKIQISLFCVI